MTSLAPGGRYSLLLVAENGRGLSPPTRLSVAGEPPSGGAALGLPGETLVIAHKTPIVRKTAIKRP